MQAQPDKHDLALFIHEMTTKLQHDYEQIRARSNEDPGTAGDQAEETWAELLRQWLPAHYHVVTKGRVLGQSGDASGQVDVIVLWPAYPKFLLQKKFYLAAGVAAAFECKLTLRPQHLEKIFRSAKKLAEVADAEYQVRRNLKRNRSEIYGYEEYHDLIEFGVLAHSHEGFGNTPDNKMTELIERLDSEIICHPREMVDLICVQNLGCWSSIRAPYTRLVYNVGTVNGAPSYTTQSIPCPQTGYTALTKSTWAAGSSYHSNFSPLGALFARLTKKLSYNDKMLDPLSQYYVEPLSNGKDDSMKRIWQDLQTPQGLWELYNRRPGGLNWGQDIFLGF
jgi:hypothetical protein